MTVDSLLNLDNEDIRTEVAFSGIDHVRLVGEDRLFLKYKAESFEKPIICRDAAQLHAALSHAMARFKHDEEVEESTTVSEGRRETAVDLLPRLSLRQP